MSNFILNVCAIIFRVHYQQMIYHGKFTKMFVDPVDLT